MMPIEEANRLTHLIRKCSCGKAATRYVSIINGDIPFCEECFKAMATKGEQIMVEIRKKVMATYGTLKITREQFDVVMGTWGNKPILPSGVHNTSKEVQEEKK
jgi:hypothetical protein